MGGEWRAALHAFMHKQYIHISAGELPVVTHAYKHHVLAYYQPHSWYRKPVLSPAPTEVLALSRCFI